MHDMISCIIRVRFNTPRCLNTVLVIFFFFENEQRFSHSLRLVSFLQRSDRCKMINQPQSRNNQYFARCYKYVVDLSEYLLHEEKSMSLASNYSPHISEPKAAMIFSMYEETRRNMPNYFFRTPRTIMECHSSMMDALDVLREDRRILLEWNEKVDKELALLADRPDHKNSNE